MGGAAAWSWMLVLAALVLAPTVAPAPAQGALVPEASTLTRPLLQAPADLVIDQLHIIVSVAEESLWISEVYLLGNRGDAVVGGDAGGTVVFPLPEGAQQVTYEGAGATVGAGAGPYLRVDGGIADTRPITPGVAMVEARFAYELPFAPGDRISRPMPLPVQSGVLLLAGASWKLVGPEVDSPSLLGSGSYVDLGLMDFGGGVARAYMIEALDAGETLAFEIVAETRPVSELAPPADLGQAPVTGGTQGPSLLGSRAPDLRVEVGIGAVALLGAAAVSYGLWRPERTRPEAARAVPPDEVLDDLRALARLDAQFAAGKIDASAYRRLRAPLKARARLGLYDRNSRTD